MARHCVWTRRRWKRMRRFGQAVRRDTGESYESYLKELARKSGIEEPSRADIAGQRKSRTMSG